jgi:hemolysin activation/secretion protein
MSFLHLIIITAFLALSFTHSAHAQITPDDQQRALDNLQQQEQKQENFIKHLSKEYERKERERATTPLQIPQTEESYTTGGPCFDIATINLNGVTVLSESTKENLTAEYIGTCMDIAAISRLMRDITNYYNSKGYVTTRVAIPQQELNKGTLELLVIEGKIEDIKLNENSTRDRRQVRTAFGFFEGNLLNLRDVEQGLDQINRLASSNATIELEPGTKEGYTVIIINNRPVKPNRASLGYDNSGQDFTGKNKGRLSLERDNLFGIGDYWSFTYNEDTTPKSRQKNSQIYAGQFSVPFGYWTFSANLSRSKYLSAVQGINQSFISSGKTGSGTIKLERILHRAQNSKTSADIGITHKNTANFIEDVKLASSSRALSILKLGTNHTHRAFGNVLFGAIGYERGLDAFGARGDTDNLDFQTPRAQFDKYTLDASIYRPFAVNDLNFAFRSTASGQYSPDPLFSSEQVNIGDRYTVRGFSQNSISGDTGGYVRNEIMWNPPRWTEEEFVNNLIGDLQPYVGLDFGATRSRGGKSDQNPRGLGYMKGWAVGLRNNSQWLTFDAAYAQAIQSPAYIDEKNHEIYFTVGVKLGF